MPFGVYRLSKANDGAPGIDGVTFEAIEAAGVEGFLAQLREELEQRTYRPLRVRSVRIPKADGGTRQLSIPAIRDRVVGTAPWKRPNAGSMIGEPTNGRGKHGCRLLQFFQ
jgi:retron-type reverse transcriptase